MVDGLLNAIGSFTGQSLRGSHLSDFRDPAQHSKLLGNPKSKHLDERTSSALRSATSSGATVHWADFFTKHHQKVDTYKKITIGGVPYQTRLSAIRDCHITFESRNEIWCGCIDQILLPGGISDIQSVLLSVETFAPLSQQDQEKDPYRLWGFSGGELLYENFLDSPSVIAPTQILGHIVKTSVGKVFGIDRPCVHILPLDEVCTAIFFFFSPGIHPHIRSGQI